MCKHAPSHRRADCSSSTARFRRLLLSPLMVASRVQDVRRATRRISTVVLIVGLVITGIAGRNVKGLSVLAELGSLLVLGGFGGVIIPWIGQLVASYQIRRHARALLRNQRTPVDEAELAKMLGQVENNAYRLEQYDKAWSRLAVDDAADEQKPGQPWPGFKVIDGGAGDDGDERSAGLPASRHAAGLRRPERRGRS